MPWHGTLIDSKILAVHAALLPLGPKGKVVMTGGSEHNQAQGGTDEDPADPADVDRTALYDVDSRAEAVRIGSPTTDIFCAGHAQLGDGRVLLAGGTEVWGGADAEGPGGGHVHFHGNFGGERACWIYNFRRESWERTADMGFQVGPGAGGGRWYPTVITLPSGDLAAFGGHPSRHSDHWHENDLPERYSYTAHGWSWYTTHIPFEFEGGLLPGNWYPRASLATGGWLFFTSTTAGQCRFWDPATGDLVGPVVASPGPEYARGWDYSVITLPHVPGDGYRTRVMAVGGVQPRVIDLDLSSGAPTPTWADAGTRQGSAAGKNRRYSCPVYLPTGQILMTGGIDSPPYGGSTPLDTDAVKEPEIFTPAIDWNSLSYDSTAAAVGTWQTVEEPADRPRNYHSVALLLPDGSVFVSGSNINANSGDPATVGQLNIEIFEPSWFSSTARATIASAPALVDSAAPTLTFAMDTAAQAGAIERVALIRCGSVTHSCDFDHRYVALDFSTATGSPQVTATLPQDSSVLPPGYYMLWTVDGAGIPCELAAFVRIAHLSCGIVVDRNTFSKEEVEAHGAGGAPFPYALYAVYDGFLSGELTGTPSYTLEWADTNAAIPTSDIRLTATEPPWYEHPTSWEEVAQRITYPFTVEILDPTVFDGFTDTRPIRLTFEHAGQTCQATLRLSHSPNPYMIDVDPDDQNPHWLSTDIRTFRIRAGQPAFGDIFQGTGPDAPEVFAKAVIDRFRSLPHNDAHPFQNMAIEGDAAAVDLAPSEGGVAVYNYAIARVRYRATTTTASQVKCFFRLCTTAATGLHYDADTFYRHSGPGASTVPRLGTVGGAIASVPFFLSPRQQTVAGEPGADSMDAQTLAANYEVQDIAPDAGGDEVVAYFACWLDINRPDQDRFPLSPGSSDGPWPASACQPIQEHFRSPHHCLVAEVYFEDDATQPGDSPSSSDNLAQRNLLILNADNPGAPGSRMVVHPFEVAPSRFQLPKGIVEVGAVAHHGLLHDRRFAGPDELMFVWHDLPRASEVTLTFSGVDTAELQELTRWTRRGEAGFDAVDGETIRLRVTNCSWVPVPAGRAQNIPALLSIQLPEGIVAGEHFRVTVHQVSGRDRTISGSFEVSIPVTKAELMLDREIRTLSLMKHIGSTIPSTDRWHPIFLRYLHHLGQRVDALGGDAQAVAPNPDGSGRPAPDAPTRDEPDPTPQPEDTVGPAVRDLVELARHCCTLLVRLHVGLLILLVLLLLVALLR